jgi:hypothetical protein
MVLFDNGPWFNASNKTGRLEKGGNEFELVSKIQGRKFHHVFLRRRIDRRQDQECKDLRCLVAITNGRAGSAVVMAAIVLLGATAPSILSTATGSYFLVAFQKARKAVGRKGKAHQAGGYYE